MLADIASEQWLASGWNQWPISPEYTASSLPLILLQLVARLASRVGWAVEYLGTEVEQCPQICPDVAVLCVEYLIKATRLNNPDREFSRD